MVKRFDKLAAARQAEFVVLSFDETAIAAPKKLQRYDNHVAVQFECSGADLREMFVPRKTEPIPATH